MSGDHLSGGELDRGESNGEGSTGGDELSYDEVLTRIGELAAELVAHPDPLVADRVQELLDWVDAFHRDGLGRLVDMIRAWRGEIFLESVAADVVTGTLLAAYGLGEDPAAAADAIDSVAAALDELRPYAESHGGTIEMESVVDGVVRVRLLGSCDGCPSSSVTLSRGVEEALRRHYVHFRRLEVVDDGEAAGDSSPEEGEPLPSPAALLQIRGHEGA